MKELNRLGLGAMGMSSVRNPENSVKTIHAALDAGITLFNTGEFYNAGESELIVGQALKGINHDNYFLSVKFDVLPSPEGGIYGLDVKPHNVKGHLTYSLRRLGLLAPEYREKNLAMILKVKEIADEKGVTLSQLALAWSLAKYDHVQSLVGTTNPAHLQEAIDALSIELTAEDIVRMETALDAEKVGGKGMWRRVSDARSYRCPCPYGNGSSGKCHAPQRHYYCL